MGSDEPEENCSQLGTVYMSDDCTELANDNVQENLSQLGTVNMSRDCNQLGSDNVQENCSQLGTVNMSGDCNQLGSDNVQENCSQLGTLKMSDDCNQLGTNNIHVNDPQLGTGIPHPPPSPGPATGTTTDNIEYTKPILPDNVLVIQLSEEQEASDDARDANTTTSTPENDPNTLLGTNIDPPKASTTDGSNDADHTDVTSRKDTDHTGYFCQSYFSAFGGYFESTWYCIRQKYKQYTMTAFI